MRVTKLFLTVAIVLGLGLSACSNDDDISTSGGEEKGNTHVSVALKLGGASTRALPNDYNEVGEWAGKDKVETITIFVSNMSAVTTHNFVVGEDYVVKGNFLKPLAPAAIKTTAGPKKVFVLVNATEDALNQIAAAGTGANAFEAAYAAVLKLENSGTAHDPVETSASKIAKVDDDYDVIMMTNVEPQTIEVYPNVDQAATIAGENQVNINVERAVARVMVTTAATSYDVTADGGTTIGKISNITWVLAQGENSLFIQRKTDWVTPKWDFVPTTDEAYWKAGDNYDYSGLFENYDAATKFGGTTVPELSTYAALNAAGDNKAEVLASLGLDDNAVNGKFVLPTTHEIATGEASGFKKGNTVYAMIRAKFTPGAFADDGEPDEDGTFYLGANGQFYTSAKAAYDPAGNGVTQKVTKYVGGKVIYYAWANPDEIPEWYNSPVLRNNIYHIHITGFKTIGTNWNPLYPEDPKYYDPTHPEYDPDDPNNIEDPKNPDPKPNVTVPDPENPGGPEIPVEEPENPIDPTDPLTTPETWMSVDVKVLPWKLHSYEVELGI
ncbi:Mfa1 family fimbria major subunit [Dysgonomonas sp. Marseille-P4361]|uniref:Mfa1 family fimbria major subunit n=1 Tax=Dysgonomonas sp. Marseille-P4361 TaxID=2161820 RepID=UPI000D55BBC3|nr:Mfa1 family fimbria major subunit [Dysgonomonas sp. Marseille-P4361]